MDGVAPVFLLIVISFSGVVNFGKSNQALLARDTTDLGMMGFLVAGSAMRTVDEGAAVLLDGKGFRRIDGGGGNGDDEAL